MSEDASIIDEVEGHYEAVTPTGEPRGWCRGCEADWPCITQRLVAEIQASRKKLAAIRFQAERWANGDITGGYTEGTNWAGQTIIDILDGTS